MALVRQTHLDVQGILGKGARQVCPHQISHNLHLCLQMARLGLIHGMAHPAFQPAITALHHFFAVPLVCTHPDAVCIQALDLGICLRHKALECLEMSSHRVLQLGRLSWAHNVHIHRLKNITKSSLESVPLAPKANSDRFCSSGTLPKLPGRWIGVRPPLIRLFLTRL